MRARLPVDVGAVNAGLDQFTVSEALAGAVLAPALPEVSAPTASVVVYVPIEVPVTLKVTVHVAPAGIVPPDSEACGLGLLLSATTTPPHVVDAPEFATLARPVG